MKAPSELCGQDVLRICLAPRLSKTSFQDVPRMSAAIQRFEFMNCCQKLGKCRNYEEILQHCSSCSIAAAAPLQQQHCSSSNFATTAALQQQPHCSSSIAAAAAATLQQQQHCSNSTQHTNMHEANDVKNAKYVSVLCASQMKVPGDLNGSKFMMCSTHVLYIFFSAQSNFLSKVN